MVSNKGKRDLFSVKVKKEGKTRNGKLTKNKDKRLKKPKKHHNGPAKEGSGGSGSDNNKTEHLHTMNLAPISYQTLAVGQVMLGCVCEVRDYELLISLPHRMMGRVSLAHISKEYTQLLAKLKDGEDVDEVIHSLQDLYSPGQYVVACVVSIEKVNNIMKVGLSLMPKHVNHGIGVSSLQKGLVIPCAIASVEDKGYVVDTGIADVSAAFVKKKDIMETGSVGVGSVLRCAITDICGSDTEDNIRLTLTAHPKVVNAATMDVNDTMNLALLIPGTAVNTTVSKISKDELILSLAGVDGVVNQQHVAKPFDLLTNYSPGDSVKARVLFITPLSKVVHFTLQNIMCDARSASDSASKLKIGDIVQDAEVYRTSACGIHVKLDSNTRGFCSGNRMTDSNTVLTHITRDFPAGRKVKVRLMKYSYMDQLFVVSRQSWVFKEQFVSYSELKAGQLLRATVSKHRAAGAELAISKVVTGLVPWIHLKDRPQDSVLKKYPLGTQVTARVLRVNPAKQHLFLTLKTSLVKAKDTIITEFTKEAEDTVTIGYIAKIFPSFLLVRMFNDVAGSISKDLACVEDEELRDKFYEGQVVRCKVLKVDPEQQRINLCLLKAPAKINLGSRVSCRVNEVNEDVIRVTICPSGSQAEIPVYHLSDDPEKCELMRDIVKKDDEITEAVVFSVKGDAITLTLKPSVCHWLEHASEEVKANKNLVAGESYPAVVGNIKPHGLMVDIPIGQTGKQGLVHIKQIKLSEQYSGMNELGAYVGQSLYVAYTDVDDRGRPILTLALKDNLKNKTQSSLQLLCSYLNNEQTVTQGMLLHRDLDSQRLANYAIGDKVAAVVEEVTPEEIHVRVKNNNLKGTVLAAHIPAKKTFEVGQNVIANVLHVNQEDKSLELTLKPAIRQVIHTRTNEDLPAGLKVKCKVVLVKKFFTMVVIMEDKYKGMVVYIPSVKHLNCLNEQPESTVGRSCWVVVKHVNGPLVLGVRKKEVNRKEKLNLTTMLPMIIFSQPKENSEDKQKEDEEEPGDIKEAADQSIASDNDAKKKEAKNANKTNQSPRKRKMEEREANVSKKAKKSTEDSETDKTPKEEEEEDTEMVNLEEKENATPKMVMNKRKLEEKEPKTPEKTPKNANEGNTSNLTVEEKSPKTPKNTPKKANENTNGPIVQGKSPKTPKNTQKRQIRT